MRKISIFMFFILFLFVGCMQEVRLIDQAGSALPKERYYGASTTKPFFVTWYLYSTTSIIDRDKSEHIIPEYLSASVEHTFNKNQIKKVVLAIHVTNERGSYYELLENCSYTTKVVYKIGSDQKVEPMWRNTTYIGKETKTRKKVVAKSELKYRIFNIELPLEDILTCTYELEILDGDGGQIFKIGKIKYSVTSY